MGSIACAVGYQQEKSRKNHKAVTRKMKCEFNLTDRSYQLKKAQEAFNAFIRERDKGLPCISCGGTGNKMTAGHFKTDKSLRFHPDNCHGQCWWNCNMNKSGNIAEYRPNLVLKIGDERVEYLEQYHPPANWTLFDIIEIKKLYRVKLKELIKKES